LFFAFSLGLGFLAVWLDITQERRSIVGRLIDQNRSQNFLSLYLSLCVSVHAFSFPGKQIFTGPMIKLFFLPDPTTTTSAIWFWFWFWLWSVEVQIFCCWEEKGEREYYLSFKAVQKTLQTWNSTTTTTPITTTTTTTTNNNNNKQTKNNQ